MPSPSVTALTSTSRVFLPTSAAAATSHLIRNTWSRYSIADINSQAIIIPGQKRHPAWS
jgi:hypothetical protein